MSPNYRKLFILNIVALSIFMFINIFVNLYIWEANQKIRDVALFNGVMCVASLLASFIGSKLLELRTVRSLFLFFVLFSLCSFLFISFIELPSFSMRIIWIGVLIGLMSGFFWIAHNFSINSFGKGEETFDFLSKHAILNQVIGILIPLLSAFAIYIFGYIGSFVLMGVISALMLYTIIQMPKVSLRAEKKFTWTTIFQKPSTKWFLLSSTMVGVFWQFQGLFVLIYTFTLTENIFLIAILSVLYTVLTIVTLIVYKKWKIFTENQWLFVGMLLMSLGFIVALFGVPLFYLLSNIFSTIGMFFINTVFVAQAFRVFENEPPYFKIKMLLLRELGLNIGRGFMLFLSLFLIEPNGLYFLSIMALAIVLSLSLPLVQKKMLNQIK